MVACRCPVPILYSSISYPRARIRPSYITLPLRHSSLNILPTRSLRPKRYGTFICCSRPESKQQSFTFDARACKNTELHSMARKSKPRSTNVSDLVARSYFNIETHSLCCDVLKSACASSTKLLLFSVGVLEFEYRPIYINGVVANSIQNHIPLPCMFWRLPGFRLSLKQHHLSIYFYIKQPPFADVSKLFC
jgi:hypothetical protein